MYFTRLVCVFCSLDQIVNNFNELENLRIAELLQYRRHVYTTNAEGKGLGQKGKGWERVGKPGKGRRKVTGQEEGRGGKEQGRGRKGKERRREVEGCERGGQGKAGDRKGKGKWERK